VTSRKRDDAGRKHKKALLKKLPLEEVMEL
jgi:hypothetical protein